MQRQIGGSGGNDRTLGLAIKATAKNQKEEVQRSRIDGGLMALGLEGVKEGVGRGVPLGRETQKKTRSPVKTKGEKQP